MKPIRVFLDSDVVISSLLSSLGAAYLLVHHSQPIKFISNLSQEEIIIVAKRLKIPAAKTRIRLKKLSVVTLKTSLVKIRHTFKPYVTDDNDSHIVAGAVAAKAGFLLTYNLKHYQIEAIKRKYQILVLRPAQFLQYLRSL